jgi:hemerythrin
MTTRRDSRESTEPPGWHRMGGTEPGSWPLDDAELQGADVDAEIGLILAAVASLPAEAEAVPPETWRCAGAALEQELAAHMARQAEAMRAASYPLTEGHRAAHDRLLAELGPLLRLIGDAAALPEARRMVAEEVVIRLVAHVVAYDTGLAAYLKGLDAR